MNNYLKGKTVALVGPAKSIEGSNNGAHIDSHDVVVRLNHARIGNTMDSGERTDIIYYDGSYHDYGDIKVDHLVCSYPQTEWFFAERCLQPTQYYAHAYPNKHSIVGSTLYHDLKASLDGNNKSRPNTGLVALVDLLRHDIKSLFLTGMDFYRSSYAKEHPDYGGDDLSKIRKVFNMGDNGDYHDIEGQFQYFKNNLYLDSRLEVDDFLKKYLVGIRK